MAHPANQKLKKTEFNSQEDWETYPTADYCCDKCTSTVSLNFANLKSHQLSTFSNFNKPDKEAFNLFVSTNNLEPTNSFLDFYCPSCKRPVRMYYNSWAGGRHGEQGYSIKYVVE